MNLSNKRRSENKINYDESVGEQSIHQLDNLFHHSESEEITEDLKRPNLHYKFDENPPWTLTIFLGFQHFLCMIGSTISVPFVLCPALCMSLDDPNRSQIISTLIFVAGISTFFQTTFGSRLPVIQGDSFSYIIPTLAILSLPTFSCPSTFNYLKPSQNGTLDDEIWQIRMREISGAIIVAGVVEGLLGFFGIIGLILKFITPLTFAPSIIVVGLSLFRNATEHASSNWAISLSTILLIIIFSQFMNSIKMSSSCIDQSIKYPIFEIFSILLSVSIMWSICALLTVTNTIEAGQPGRTDNSLNVQNAPWFRIPYPFQWGWPTFSIGSIIGMLAGVISSCMEGIGNFYSTAKVSGASKPPKHAINRGIFFKGFGTILGGILGSGNGTTFHSEHTGTMTITKVASRRIFQCAAVLMIIFSVFSKFGAFFISIPPPIVGGLFFIIFGSITSVGISCLQNIDMNSQRNQFIVGFSIFSGLSISEFMGQNPKSINTGIENLDQTLYILLRTGMLISGFLGFILDNTIPATATTGESSAGKFLQDQDSKNLEQQSDSTTESTGLISGKISNKDYDLPIGMALIRRSKCLKRLPISPTYN